MNDIIDTVHQTVIKWRRNNLHGPSELRMSKGTIKMLAKAAGIKKKPKGGWAAPGSTVLGLPIIVSKGMEKGVVEASMRINPIAAVSTSTEEP